MQPTSLRATADSWIRCPDRVGVNELRIYEVADDSPVWVCGHWNGSPIEIGFGLRSEVGPHEVRHHHPYCEYYVVLEGSAVIEVDGKQVSEPHRVYPSVREGFVG